MPVPAFISAIRWLRRPLRVSAALLALCGLALARTPDQIARISLESIGFEPPSKQMISAGASVFTLHYVDDSHMLVTFAVRRLLKRLPECPPADQDRTVAAVLIDSPSGHVLARAEWRVHDLGQYLWSLGNGHFLLRTQNHLVTFSPLAGHSPAEAFRLRPALASARSIGAVLLSPTASLLTVETFDPSPNDGSASGDRAPGGPRPVQINFYRVAETSPNSDEIRFTNAGTVRSARPTDLPVDASGFVDVVEERRPHWAFNFNTYAGKVTELSPFESSCHPVPYLVSRSEFVSFGCHNGGARMVLGGFNLRGEEMWEQNFFEPYILPTFAFAPTAGRFALSRVLVSGALPDVSAFAPDLLTGQNITVYQTESGRQLLNLQASPAQRSSQNYSLSPDGMSLAVLRDTAIEIHRLPALSTKDTADLRKAQALVPELSYDPVDLRSSKPATVVASSPAVPDTPPPPPSIAAPAPDPAATPSVDVPPADQNANRTADSPSESPVVNGDDTSVRRKPPTLYNPPSDTPPEAPQK